MNITIEVMRLTDLEAGERVMARADGAGRVMLEGEEDVLECLAGSLLGVFQR